MRKLLFTSIIAAATFTSQAQTVLTTTVGALEVKDSLNVMKDITAQGDVTVKGELLLKDTLTTRENINAKKNVNVEGTINVGTNLNTTGIATFENTLLAKDGIAFDNLNSLKFIPGTATTGDVFKLGKGTYDPLPAGCLKVDKDPWFYFGGRIQLFDAALGHAVSLGSDGATSTLETWGGEDRPNALKINYYCGKPTFINTGWNFDPDHLKNGGAVYMGAEVDMRRSLKIGWTQSGIIDPNTSIEINQNTPYATGVKVKTWQSSVNAFAIELTNGTNPFFVKGDGTTQTAKFIATADAYFNTNANVGNNLTLTNPTGILKVANLAGTNNRSLQADATGKIIAVPIAPIGSPNSTTPSALQWSIGGDIIGNLTQTDKRIGTSDAENFILKSNNVTRINITSNGTIYFGAKKIIASHVHANSNYQFDGKVSCKELVVVDPVKWADFVFDANYKLMPLTDVENYYNKNHHLPSVPTEADVKQNGINTAQMDATLLQKIEELTLYLVQQQKEINALKKQVNNK